MHVKQAVTSTLRTSCLTKNEDITSLTKRMYSFHLSVIGAVYAQLAQKYVDV